jgi:outer membrane lipoprotein-sorting protein
MKKLVLFCIAIATLSFAQAQDAMELLNEVSAKVKSYNNFSIDFKLKLDNAKEGISQETRGDVVIAGNKYKLNMNGATEIFDGKNIYRISPVDEEVTIEAYDPNNDKTITPSKMMSFYEKGYTYKMDILQNVKGRKIQYVKLIPIDSKAEFKSYLLGIDAQTKHIYNLIQIDSKGTKYTTTVNSFKTNEPLSKSMFTFDEAKYKKDGYYINKM